jgi:hypothetical protein
MAARRPKRARNSSDGPSEVESLNLRQRARPVRTMRWTSAPKPPKPSARFQAALAQMREEGVSAHTDDKQRRIAIYTSHNLDRFQWSQHYNKYKSAFPARALVDNPSTAAAATTMPTISNTASSAPISTPGAGAHDSSTALRTYVTKKVRVENREQRVT